VRCPEQPSQRRVGPAPRSPLDNPHLRKCGRPHLDVWGNLARKVRILIPAAGEGRPAGSSARATRAKL
jgi:hypothetical protein